MTSLIVMNDNYSDDQAGYNQAKIDGAVHWVNIDEQSYTAMYNVQQSISAMTSCTGVNVSMGLVKGDKYVSLSVAEDIDFKGWEAYESLDGAFAQGEHIQLQRLRDAVDSALDNLAEALGECEERKTIDHCTDCIEGQRRNFNLPHDIAVAQQREDNQ